MFNKPDGIDVADLVFCDPPYKKNLIIPSLKNLIHGGWVADGSVFVVEAEKQVDLRELNFEVIVEKTYKDTRILIMAKANMRGNFSKT